MGFPDLARGGDAQRGGADHRARQAPQGQAPNLGLRIKLSAQAGGHCGPSPAATASVFGLNMAGRSSMSSTASRKRRCSTACRCCTTTSARRSPTSAISVQRRARGLPLLRRPGQGRCGARLPRHRRRPGGRLRRLPDQLPQQPQLHHRGVLHRHRRGDHDRAATNRASPTRHHHRVGPRHGRLLRRCCSSTCWTSPRLRAAADARAAAQVDQRPARAT